MSPQASFNIGGRDRVRTPLGGLFIIINACSILMFTSYMLVNYFQKVEPSVTESTMQSKGNPLSMMAFEMPVISIYSELADGMPDYNIDRYATVYLQIRERVGSNLTKTRIPYYRCSQAIVDYPDRFKEIRNFEDYRDYISNFSFCLNATDQQFAVYNDFHSSSESHLRVYVDPCSLPQAQCASAREVKNTAIYLAYVRTTFDMNDFDSPVRKEYIELDQLTPELSVSQSIKFAMKKVQVFNVLGLPYRQELHTEASLPHDREYFKQNRINESVICTKASCESYFRIKFMDGKLLTKTYRVYKPFTRVISEIGGVKIVIYWGFFVLYMICGGGREEKKYTVRRVFRIQAEKKSWKESCKESLTTCCKKKNKVLMDPKKKYKTDENGITEAPSIIVDMAYDFFQESNDLITLAQSTYVMNLMSSVLMTGYQKSISSLVMLNCYLKDRLQNEKVQERENSQIAKKSIDIKSKSRLSSIASIFHLGRTSLEPSSKSENNYDKTSYSNDRLDFRQVSEHLSFRDCVLAITKKNGKNKSHTDSQDILIDTSTRNKLNIPILSIRPHIHAPNSISTRLIRDPSSLKSGIKLNHLKKQKHHSNLSGTIADRSSMGHLPDGIDDSLHIDSTHGMHRPADSRVGTHSHIDTTHDRIDALILASLRGASYVPMDDCRYDIDVMADRERRDGRDRDKCVLKK